MFGARLWPLPLEIVSDEPVPVEFTTRLNTALPAVEVAIIETGPMLFEAVKVTLALPFAAVVAVAVVALPVSVPAPDVKISKVIGNPAIGEPRLFKAMISKFLVATVP